MDLTRRSAAIYILLAALWLLVVGWQLQEHLRVKSSAKTELRGKSKEIANTLSALIRGLRFPGGGGITQDRLESVLNELVQTNALVKSTELISVELLNAAGERVASAGKPIDLEQKDLAQEGERWGLHTVTLINPIDLGAALSSEAITNPTVVWPPPPSEFTNAMREGRRPFSRREPRTEEAGGTNSLASTAPAPPPGERKRMPGDDPRRRRPPWLRGMEEKEYETLVQQRALHGLVLAISTEPFQAAVIHDIWLRSIILFLSTISVVGSGLAWGNLAKSSDLQIRLVRASELNTHLKEMNLAAAGLAHETRNPLNIIRGLAQMISRQEEAAPALREKSRAIIDETDKVTAQLNEFINYSRPREVRRSTLALNSVVNEVVRTLNFDVEEKKIDLEVKGEQLNIEADEQLLRQTLFNLLLNAIQAVNGDGKIEVLAEKRTASEAALEIRDNGPGVPADRRSEIFKPYFTTQKTGTGLGLAVVQQIVLAHGWEIECLPNQPNGAVFRITHLKLAA
jgi:signal transduction histidine kinase